MSHTMGPCSRDSRMKSVRVRVNLLLIRSSLLKLSLLKLSESVRTIRRPINSAAEAWRAALRPRFVFKAEVLGRVRTHAERSSNAMPPRTCILLSNLGAFGLNRHWGGARSIKNLRMIRYAPFGVKAAAF